MKTINSQIVYIQAIRAYQMKILTLLQEVIHVELTDTVPNRVVILLMFKTYLAKGCPTNSAVC